MKAGEECPIDYVLIFTTKRETFVYICYQCVTREGQNNTGPSKEILEIPKGQSEAVKRKTDNTMAKRKKTNEQTAIGEKFITNYNMKRHVDHT